jgi:uncharacterized protein
MARETPTSTTNLTPRSQSEADALIFNVAGLLGEPAGTVQDIVVACPALDPGAGPVQTRGITGELRFSRTNRGLLVRGRLSTAIALICSRCLRDIDCPVEIKLDDEALPSLDLGTGVPVETEDDVDVLRLTTHHELDLNGVVRDAIALAEPIAPICREDCLGLCIVCGLELSGGPHDHPDEDIDPRLEGLRQLIDSPDAE